MSEKTPQTLQLDFNYKLSLVKILSQLKSSIVISTYQAGQLVLVGANEDAINLETKEFMRPMGMCRKGDKLWVGLGHGIWQFSNYSGALKDMKDTSYDALYLPQNIHLTGNIDIHEMEYCNNDLYFINTKFSCLCVREGIASFKPVWKPPFISVLQPTDRCHLNGFCARDGMPRYVTALGTSDEPLGWKATKANGGILMDIQTNTILASGLSMPHSPRWHQDKLWLLESGKGSLAYYDFDTKQVVTVATLPGFTRGLKLIGDLAFIGLSKIRESATFSGLEVSKIAKRVSGVWVVNIKTGEIVSTLEFHNVIDEIFAVDMLPFKHVELMSYDNHYSKEHYMVTPEDYDSIKMPETTIERAAPVYEKGCDLYNENQKEAALAEFEKALSIDSDYLPASLKKAITLHDLKRYKEAAELLEYVIHQDASIKEAYAYLGKSYRSSRKPALAKKAYSTLLELDPENAEAKEYLKK